MKRNSQPKRHHILPEKAYLDGFTTDGLLWVFDVKDKQFLQLKPKETTIRKDYYSFVDASGNKDSTVENPVLSGIENATIPVIRKLENREEITMDDRWVLSLFVAGMFVRTTAFERMHDRMGNELHRFRNRFIFSSPAKIRKMLEALPDHVRSASQATAEEIYEFVQGENYDVVFHRNASLEMVLELMIEFAPILASFDWIVSHCTSEAIFLTTDSPFVISAPRGSQLGFERGLLVRGATKGIALTRRICLTMGDPGGFMGYNTMECESVRQNNLAFAAHAERFIISPTENLLREIVNMLGMESVN